MSLLKKLNKICAVDQKYSGIEYLQELAKNISFELDIKYVLIGRPQDQNEEILQTDVAISEGTILENFSYELRGTPCLNVYSGKRVCIHEKAVASLFPDDKLLTDMGVQCYIGAPILNKDGALLGLIVLLDDKELKDVDTLSALCEFFAARISGEFLRMEGESRLLAINTNLESIIEERTAELESLSEKLRDDNSILEQALDDNSKLLATIFHDISNPLSIAYIESNKLSTVKVDGLERSFSNLDYSINQVVKIIENIKHMFSDGSLEEQSEVRVDKIVDYAQFIFSKKLEDKSLKLDYSKTDLAVRVHEVTFLNSVFNNFISNAIKFSTIGGKIFIDTKCDGDYINLSIQDEGSGVSEKLMDSIDNDEKILSTLGTKGELGTGIGLSLTKSYLSKMGGTFTISNNEIGAIVQIKLLRV